MTDNVVPFAPRKPRTRTRAKPAPDTTVVDTVNNWAPSRLQQARELRGLSRTELGEQIGRTPIAIVHWESGIATPKAYEVERLAEVLHVLPRYFAAGRPQITLDSSHVHFCEIDERR